MINLFCGFFKLCLKISLIVILMLIMLLIGIGVFTLFTGMLSAVPCLIAGITVFGVVLCIPLLFVKGFVKALIK